MRRAVAGSRLRARVWRCACRGWSAARSDMIPDMHATAQDGSGGTTPPQLCTVIRLYDLASRAGSHRTALGSRAHARPRDSSCGGEPSQPFRVGVGVACIIHYSRTHYHCTVARWRSGECPGSLLTVARTFWGRPGTNCGFRPRAEPVRARGCKPVP